MTSSAAYGQIVTETSLVINTAQRRGRPRPLHRRRTTSSRRAFTDDPAQTAIIAKWNTLAGPLKGQVVGTHAEADHSVTRSTTTRARRDADGRPRRGRDPVGHGQADGCPDRADERRWGAGPTSDAPHATASRPAEITFAEAFDIAAVRQRLRGPRPHRRPAEAGARAAVPAGRRSRLPADARARCVRRLHLRLGRHAAAGLAGRPRVDEAQRHADRWTRQTVPRRHAELPRRRRRPVHRRSRRARTAWAPIGDLEGLVAFFEANQGLTAPPRTASRVSDPAGARPTREGRTPPGCGPRRVRLPASRGAARARARRVPHTVTPCRAPPHRPPSADPTSGSTTATGSRTPTPGCGTLEDPALLRPPRGGERLRRGPHGAPRAAAHDDLRGDPLAGEGDRPVGAGRERPLVVLRPHGRGPPVRLARPRAARPTRRCVRTPRRTPCRASRSCVDGNVEAGDSEFFSLGALTVSADHRLVAFAVDTAGDERFDAHRPGRRDRRGPRHLDHRHRLRRASSAATAGSCSTPGSTRPGGPYQLWRHRVGGDPADDVLVHQEDDERFWMGVSSSRDERWLLLGLGSKTTSEVHLLDADDPEGDVARRRPPPRGRRVRRRARRRPAPHRAQHRHARRRPRVGADRRDEPEQWVPWLRSGEGERFVSVDAFDRRRRAVACAPAA